MPIRYYDGFQVEFTEEENLRLLNVLERKKLDTPEAVLRRQRYHIRKYEKLREILLGGRNAKGNERDTKGVHKHLSKADRHNSLGVEKPNGR